MNAVRLMLLASLVFATGMASAHPPGPSHHPQPPQVPQPVAPSTLPYEYEIYLDSDGYPYAHPHAIDHRYEYDTREPCIAQDMSQAPEASESVGSHDAAVQNAIDWCALAPYRHRYAPQVPASWWWRQRSPWRYRKTR